MNEQKHEIEERLRELRDEVAPPPQLQGAIVEELRSQSGAQPRPRRLWSRVAVVAALLIVTTLSIWLTRTSYGPETADESLEGRLEFVRTEVELIMSALEEEHPEDARRLDAEFDRVLSSMSAIAAQVDQRGDADGRRNEFATLMDEQLRLVELAVALQIAGNQDR